jgi:transposase
MGLTALQITRRAQALAFFQAKLRMKTITEKTKLNRRTVYRIKQRAMERGYHPNTNPGFQDSVFKDKPRSGRPSLLGPTQLRTFNLLSFLYGITDYF